MQRSTVKNVVLSLILASALPLAACSDSDSPTSPTQPGPPVTETVTGPVINLSRSGEGGLDVTFRINDTTVVRASASTPVIDGSTTGKTDALREGQNVTVEGTRAGGFLDATKVVINAP